MANPTKTLRQVTDPDTQATGYVYVPDTVDCATAGVNSAISIPIADVMTTLPAVPAAHVPWDSQNCALVDGPWVPDNDNGPSYVPPTGSTLPEWISSLVYDFQPLNGQQVLSLRATGAVVEMKFARQDGQAFTTSNPDNVPITSGTFYGYGTFNGQRRWQAYMAQVPLRITARRENSTETTEFLFTPVSNASGIPLGSTSGTATGTATSTILSWYGVTRLGIDSDRGAKDLDVLINVGSGNYEAQLIPRSGQNAPVPSAFTTMSVGSYTLQGRSETFNRKLRYQPGFAGGADITIGDYDIVVRPVGNSSQSFTRRINIASNAGRQTELFNAPTGTGTTTGTGTGTGRFRYGVAIGNSITEHPIATQLGWNHVSGMAASSQSTDYVHVLENSLRASGSPNLTLLPVNRGSIFEQFYNNGQFPINYNDFTQDIVQAYGSNQVDLLIISISENINAGLFNEAAFRSGLDSLIGAVPLKPGAMIVLRNSFWTGNDNSNAVLLDYAATKGYRFANLDAIRERADYKASEYASINAGVAHHPNDAGHAAIAGLYAQQINVTA